MKALGVKGMTQTNDKNDPVQELNLKGEMEVIEFDNDSFLKTFYKFIETDIIEAVHLRSLGVTMWLDEEGKLKNNVLPNIDGSLLYINEFKVMDKIMGHIIFTSDQCDEEGYTLGLTDEGLEKIRKTILRLQENRPDTAFATDVLENEPQK